jgi:tetratricopeptide (TPR) repeat protein
MKKRIIGVILAFLAHIVGVQSQEIGDKEFTVKAREGINHIYNLEFESAESLLHELVAARPRHPAGHFFLAMVDWWRIMIDVEDRRYDERFLDALDRVVDLCDELLDENERDADALFFKGGALGFAGRLKFHRDDWFAAANAGRKALPLVQEASEADPANYDVFLGTGIYNYYAEIIPEQYPVAKPLLLFIPSGDKSKGISQLQSAASKGTYASVEAKYFLMQLYYLYEKRFSEALVLALELHERYPNNMLFHRYVGRCHIAMANFPKAREIFQPVLALAHQRKPGYNARVEREAEYYLGVCELNARNHDEALKHFERCLTMSRTLDADDPSGFMILATLNVGKIHDVQRRRERALAFYEEVLEMKEYRNSHTDAERFMRTPFSH